MEKLKHLLPHKRDKSVDKPEKEKKHSKHDKHASTAEPADKPAAEYSTTSTPAKSPEPSVAKEEAASTPSKTPEPSDVAKEEKPAEGEEEHKPSKNELKKKAKEAEKERRKAEKAAKLAEEEKKRQEALKDELEHDFAHEFYGEQPLNQSQARPGETRTQIADLSPAMDGKPVIIRARIHTTRAQGSKMVFMNLRQRADTVQVLLTLTDGKVSKPMVKWVEHLALESIVLVYGTVKTAPEHIKSATIGDVEVQVERIYLISGPTENPAFLVDDANRPEEEFEREGAHFNRVLLDTRLNNRVLDLRTTTNHAIFKLQAQIAKFFRDFLDGKGFVEIHSPKLQGAATESGASVFKVSYFKGQAFLAQSPQLAKQMAIAADFERVYEIGPVFRAEDSNTHRHLTEFTGLDLEMAIEEHYHEVMELLDEMFKYIFTQIKQHHQKEVDLVNLQYPAEEFKWRDETLKFTFAEAVDMLVEDGVDRAVLDDINTENEKRLGKIVKQKYDVDYYIIDKFPMALRPFYTMPDPTNPELSNSYDFFMRGEEIMSGAQRIHVPKMLEERMKAVNIEPASMAGYVDGFRMGCPPHGGGGVGLERVLMLFLKLGNVRRASLFPRDPKRLEP